MAANMVFIRERTRAESELPTAVYGRHEVIEGPPQVEGVAVLRFASFDVEDV
jgi:hypothetical protein